MKFAMDFYENNMNILKEQRTPLYERLQKWEAEKEEEANPLEKIYATEAKDGNAVLHIVKEGKDVRLNSPYRPEDEAKKWAAQFDFQNLNTYAVMFGMGNLLFVKELLNNMKEDGKLALYEPSISVFQWNMSNTDMTELFKDKRVWIVLEDINPDDIGRFMDENFHWTTIPFQITCHHTGYDGLFMESYRNILKKIEKRKSMAVINKDTQVYFSRSYVLNAIHNLEYVPDSNMLAEYIEGMPKDMPVIIVSAGPSLDKNIDQLKEIHNKAFILATDTAVRFLLQHDIIPDAMITIDANKPFSYLSDERIAEVPLFCALEANHEILEFHKGKKIWFKSGDFLDDFYKNKDLVFPDYNIGGSVATAAISVCVGLEFKTIVLIGQDLAYSGDVTHAGGEISGILNEEYGVKMIEGIDGKPIKSRHDWIIYLNWIEDSIKIMNKQGIEVVDATEGGAMIHGSKIMTLHEMIEEYCNSTSTFDFSSFLKSKRPTFEGEGRREVWMNMKKCLQELKDMQNMSKEAEGICDRALKLFENGISAKKAKKIDSYIERVMFFNNAIKEMLVYLLLDIYISDVATEELKDIFTLSNDKNKDAIGTLQSAKAIYSAVQKATEELYPEMEQVLEKICPSED